MTVVILIMAVATVVVVAALKMSGWCAREEERADPCDFCLRWSECNGVDRDRCPLCGKDVQDNGKR